ncbi:MAG: hypothetical protein L0H94_03690 [Nitrospira sp.]|nr:hypothetical protein [Nitrospira sp.]
MRVLVLNSGSSSLKFRIVEVSRNETQREQACSSPIMGGEVSGIGGNATLRLEREGMDVFTTDHRMRDHGDAVQLMFEQLGQERVEAVGHRVVHGGERFYATTRITAEVVEEIERLSELAPLHNPACVAGIRGAFDTAFHLRHVAINFLRLRGWGCRREMRTV